MSGRSKGLWAAAGLLVTATAAFGQGVGPGGPFESSYLVVPIGSMPEDPTQWFAQVGSRSDRVNVELDPDGPAWVKHLELPTGSAGIRSGQRVAIDEHLTIAGQRAWLGWRQEVLTPGFVWLVSTNMGFDANGGPAPGMVVDWAPPGAETGTELAFSFTALAVGTEIDIGNPRLVYMGSTPFTGTITIREYPTPEPSTCLLVAAGMLAGVRRRRSN